MNTDYTLDLHARRAVKARLGKRIGKGGYRTLSLSGGACLLVAAGILIATRDHWAVSILGFGILLYLPAIWWNYDLRKVAIEPGSLVGELSGEVLGQLDPQKTYTPLSLWHQLATDNQLLYITHHLLLTPEMLEHSMSDDATQLANIWQTAALLAGEGTLIEVGHVATALIMTMPNASAVLASFKLTESDVRAVCAWLSRNLTTARQPHQQFGGIGRDWANGFTPRLDQFGHNISLSIEAHNAHFGALVDSPGVSAIKAAFSQGTSAVALIGSNGIGKTSHAYALAQNLLADTGNPKMQHQQIIALDASAIISASQRPGEIEHLLTMLLNEAAHAGNITLFFDDAELFFSSETGAFNATQILLPALQSRVLRVIFAISPHDYQQLKATSPSFAGLLTPVVLQEPSAEKTQEIVADTAATLEYHHNVLITYAAIKEAYQLSGRYELDMAYPGKAIRLLEQSLTHAEQNIVTPHSVQAAIQQTTGVKAGTAAPVEASELLHLEDHIHERMINQVRAVSVVASALRRARAGVANPNRPIGSFLFLGPTGVGKTELAKAVAATYFGDESNMIRLDMSEYQQATDVSRLLSGGESETSSLILRVRQQPFSVVLLDEIEKAHPNILNLLLQLLDEGQLTDTQGRRVSFKDAVVIATSNAGADTIRERISSGQQLEDFETELTNQLISSGQFRPELLNRFDEIVLFRPLKPEELAQVVRLMLAGVNQTLSNQNIIVTLTDAAVAKIVAVGNDPRLGARPMRRALQRAVENTVANKILSGEIGPGSTLQLDAPDLTDISSAK